MWCLGNHYGTPKPSKEPPVSPPQSTNTNGNVNWLMPGAHPSSEGKRKRNRSNIEAMSAKDMDPPTVSSPTENYNEEDTAQGKEFFQYSLKGRK